MPAAIQEPIHRSPIGAPLSLADTGRPSRLSAATSWEEQPARKSSAGIEARATRRRARDDRVLGAGRALLPPTSCLSSKRRFGAVPGRAHRAPPRPQVLVLTLTQPPGATTVGRMPGTCRRGAALLGRSERVLPVPSEG